MGLLVLVLVVLYITTKRSGKRSSNNGVILVGPCGAGKTVIFQQLCYGGVAETVTSMSPAYSEYTFESRETSKKITMIDFPGHQRQRPALLGLLSGAKCLVVVVDSSNSKQVKEASDLLFSVLTYPLLPRSTPVIVFCNKMDVEGSKSADRVKLLLQKELATMRNTRGSMSQEGDDSSKVVRTLGQEGKPFKFDDDMPNVTFASGTALQGVSGLSALTSFLATLG